MENKERASKLRIVWHVYGPATFQKLMEQALDEAEARGRGPGHDAGLKMGLRRGMERAAQMMDSIYPADHRLHDVISAWSATRIRQAAEELKGD